MNGSPSCPPAQLASSDLHEWGRSVNSIFFCHQPNFFALASSGMFLRRLGHRVHDRTDVPPTRFRMDVYEKKARDASSVQNPALGTLSLS